MKNKLAPAYQIFLVVFLVLFHYGEDLFAQISDGNRECLQTSMVCRPE